MEIFPFSFSSFFLGIWCSILIGCSNPTYDSSLPDTSKFQAVRNLHLFRVISHLHSPYSYDACDRHGISNDQVDQDCLDHIRAALCINHIDMTFLTDHPDAMARYPFSRLLLTQTGDSVTNSGQNPYVNTLSGCSDGFKPQLSVGFEGRILALGMKTHLGSDVIARETLYKDETIELRNQLAADVGALVIIPHTESREDGLIQSLKPDGIEIENIHAITDPKIRKANLNMPPFAHIPSIITYLLDPYKELNPDFAFLGFLEFPEIYFQKWNTYINKNGNVTGLTGNDAHENTFPQKVADGERFDSVRRMTRTISNYVLAADRSVDSIKAAIKARRSYLVVEGLGTPLGLDFSVEVGQTVANVGDTVSLSGGKAIIEVPIPSLMAVTSFGSSAPVVRIELRKVLDQGQDQVVAEATDSNLRYETQIHGAYRAHIYLTPNHLKPFLGSLADRAMIEYSWIITNHIILTP